MNALTTPRSSTVPSLPVKAQLAVASMLSAIEPAGLGWVIPSERAPSGEQRQWLAERSVMITGAMQPLPEVDLRMEITALFATMGRRSGDDEDAKAIVAIYLADLAGIPGFALRQACADFRQGRAGDGKWVPTQAQIRTRANEILVGPRKELGDIERVLTAKVTPPVNHANREKVMAHVNETLEILRSKSDTVIRHRVLTQPEALEWCNREEANPRPAPPISDAIRKTLGIGE